MDHQSEHILKRDTLIGKTINKTKRLNYATFALTITTKNGQSKIFVTILFMECTVMVPCNSFPPIFKHTFTCFIKKLITLHNTDNLNDSYSQHLEDTT